MENTLLPCYDSKNVDSSVSASPVLFEIALFVWDFPRCCAVRFTYANFKIAYSRECLPRISLTLCSNVALCQASHYPRNSQRREPEPQEPVFNNARAFRHAAAADSRRPKGGSASTKGEGSFHAQLKSPVRRVNGLLLSGTEERLILVRYRLERRWQWYRHPAPQARSAIKGASRLCPKFLVRKSFSLKFVSKICA